MALEFRKMHGAGNDFVIVDSRNMAARITPPLARAIGDRNRGVGYDQLCEITTGDADAIVLTFWNRDGSLSSACGNATRCVANFLMAEAGLSSMELTTGRGVLKAQRRPDGLVEVNMGQPFLNWDEIPLARDIDPVHLPLDGDPVGVGMGNPHCVFFVGNVGDVDIETVGPRFETDPLFPKKTNVEFVEVRDENTLRMRVWERGTGVTLACGSGACAVLVAARQRGLTSPNVTIEADGGILGADWRDDGVWLTGPTMHVFDGVFTQEFLDSSSE